MCADYGYGGCAVAAGGGTEPARGHAVAREVVEVQGRVGRRPKVGKKTNRNQVLTCECSLGGWGGGVGEGAVRGGGRWRGGVRGGAPRAGVGGRGVVSVLSNLCPGPVSEVAAACLDGDFARARAQQRKLLPAIRAMFVETNPGPIKAVLAARGLMGPEMRLPMVPPSAEVLAGVLATLEAQGL